MLLRPRHLFVAIAVCALLQIASLTTRRITPALPAVAVATEGSFTPDGQYPGERFTGAAGVRAWGSWSGADANTGTIRIGPFPAPRILRFGIGGYPSDPANILRVELVGTAEVLPIPHHAVGERWHTVDFHLPNTWAGKSIQLVGIDQATGIGGWFALTEPIHGGRGDGINALLETLAAWATQGLLLGLIYAAAARGLNRRYAGGHGLAPHWIPLAAGAVVAGCGYAVFWAYFLNALAGVVLSWMILAGATVVALRRPAAAASGPDEIGGEIGTAVKLMLTVGAFHLALLHLFPSSHDFYTLAANRYREGLPGDNVLPQVLAERLFASELIRNPADEWQSSDRPPLQSGWQLLTWSANKVLRLDRRLASAVSAVWFQLLWVAAAYGLLRTFRLPRARAAGWVAALALAGFFVQNTVYTWPKLAAGAFACGTFALLLLPARGASARTLGLWAGAFAALAWLAHGGVAFSFLALAPWVAWRAFRGGQWRAWWPGVAVFAIIVLPWFAYQKLYDPPGDRLLKWHLAGQTVRDTRGTWQTIRESYATIGWREALTNKVSNFHDQVYGDWRSLGRFSAETAADRRNEEFFYTGRALTWWPVLALIALVITRRRLVAASRDLGLLAGWLGGTIVVWSLLMFGQYQAVVHHGSYALTIGLFVLFTVILERCHSRWLGIIVGLQAVTLGTTWAVANPVIRGPATGLFLVVMMGAALAWFIVRARTHALETSAGTADAMDALEADAGWKQGWERFRVWWRTPSLTVWVLAVLAVLLFLRKPHALHTPQLWAEDGNIFLTEADLFGAGALLKPYMGYLHLLPRLVAGLAPKLLDPAWWPAFYNAVSFVIWLAVLARLFTRRFDLPGKPWLALAFVVVPHTGEIFFNITNLQWITAFLLIQQVLVTPPSNARERIGDALILGVVALTGPFGVAFLPLFAWRAWRERSRDAFLLLAIAVACAAVQAWFVVRTGPRFEFQSAPLQLFPNLVILARRVVLWPLLGRDLALALPAWLIATLGCGLLGGVVAWCLRPHPWRLLRGQVALALGLITLAALYRTRPDTWAGDNLDFGDRYFYIPRVLLGWLLIWEFESGPRAVANAARLCCLAVVCVHLRGYTVPAPKDLQWAQQVEPIRQGVRADLAILPEGWTLEYRGRPAKSP
ncbi:hypothetical protein [Horticoccus sp. 23ND18S-11]|uniref:hypothetical protein n=1 Tax=Horticoccus sp. 23ND18S-11 TaxID=3391832 RepID=UPI0039C9DC59